MEIINIPGELNRLNYQTKPFVERGVTRELCQLFFIEKQDSQVCVHRIIPRKREQIKTNCSSSWKKKMKEGYKPIL